MSVKRRIRVPGFPAFGVDDLITALVLGTIGVLFIVLGPQVRWFPIDIVADAVAQPMLVLCGFVGTLYAPRVVLSTVSILLGLGIDALSGGHTFALWLIFQLVFALVGHAPPRVATAVFTACGAGTVVTGLVAFAAGAGLDDAFQFALLAALILFLPALWASNVREHATAAAAERARADAQEQLTALATQNAEVAARLSEQKVRAAAAEDLHDLVAGHISAIALQSQAALAADDGPIRTQVLSTVHASADQALAQLRRMIDVLASEDEAGTAEPTTVAETIRLARDLGIVVRGDEALTALSPDHEEALRPVFTELVANVLRHAGTRTVRIDVDPAGTITVSNPAGSSPAGSESSDHTPLPDHSGHGLENITRRLERLGGEASFTWDEGRFTAVLTLPGPIVESPARQAQTR